jgi:hypothetical protein
MGVTKRIITEEDEEGQLMLIQDILLQREYDCNHELITDKSESEAKNQEQGSVFTPVIETTAKVGFRLLLTKLTGGLL